MSDRKLSIEELRGIALPLLEEARQIALEPKELEVKTKTDRNDLVTQVDSSIEEFLARELFRLTGYQMLGEEELKNV